MVRVSADPSAQDLRAAVVRRHRGRIVTGYIREVRLDPADGRVETVMDAWPDIVPSDPVGRAVRDLSREIDGGGTA